VLKPGDVVQGTLTIGFGHTGADVIIGQRISRPQGEALMSKDLGRFESAVRRLVKVQLTQGQFDALVSFTFNCGEANLKTSTLLKKINARAPVDEVQAQFRRWTRSKGKVLAGLVKRRNAEAAMWAGEVVTHGEIVAMPRPADISPTPLVEEDRTPGKSKDVLALGGMAGLGSISAVEAIRDAVTEVRNAALDADLGLFVALASVILVGLAVWIGWRRYRQITVEARR
jgi:GH24 family phage-related lysozyme (muramidase)